MPEISGRDLQSNGLISFSYNYKWATAPYVCFVKSISQRNETVNHLCTPNPQSLNGQFKQAVETALHQGENEVIVRDLYALDFNPVLSLADMAGQRKGQASEVDRVFSYGFAYCYEQGVQKGLLSGTQALIINTHGKSHEEYHAIGMDQALALSSDHGIFAYCGFEIKQHFYFDKADRVTNETVEQWMEQLKSIVIA